MYPRQIVMCELNIFVCKKRLGLYVWSYLCVYVLVARVYVCVNICVILMCVCAINLRSSLRGPGLHGDLLSDSWFPAVNNTQLKDIRKTYGYILSFFSSSFCNENTNKITQNGEGHSFFFFNNEVFSFLFYKKKTDSIGMFMRQINISILCFYI